jgi:electron transport complex protein RnfC
MKRTADSFRLDLPAAETIVDAGLPAQVHLSLEGLSAMVETTDVVVRGQQLAVCMEAGAPGLYASIAGTIAERSDEHLVIEGAGDAGEPGVESEVAPRNLAGLSRAELRQALTELGVDVRGFANAETLVVGGLNVEPGIRTQATLLAQQTDTLAAGLAAARRLVEPRETILLLPTGSTAELPGANPHFVEPVYPVSLPELAVPAAVGDSGIDTAVFADLMRIWSLGRVMLSGRPLIETVLTIGERVVLARIGAPAGELLYSALVHAAPGDRVIAGGPLRGRTLYSLEQGISREDDGLFVVPRNAFPPTRDAPCLNCGECVIHCPARIMPNLLSRMAEFRLFERALDYHIGACIECGLCGYYCLARRPVVQYIRLAKAELRAMGLSPEKDHPEGQDMLS